MTLYDLAFKQQVDNNIRRLSNTSRENEKKRAKKLRDQAEKEMDLLRNSASKKDGDEGGERGEFYPYRYFATEGFLPGYNFPTKPVYAYLSKYDTSKNTASGDEYISRPRFLAISEFAPGASIYHEGARYVVDGVSLPLGESVSTSEAAHVCSECGYFHLGSEGVDVCKNCGSEQIEIINDLLEYRKVTAKRSERITCNEEERQRKGYDVVTSYRFADRGNGEGDAREGKIILADGDEWGDITYGDAASIYLINLGLFREDDPAKTGFYIHPDNNAWIDDSVDAPLENDNPKPKKDKRAIHAVPYVRDEKNCVILRPKEELSPDAFASLQAALQRAIERVFSIESRELGVYPLPSEGDRRSLLLYEASEGGAGTLRQLLDSGKFQKVILTAFEVCHCDHEGVDIEDESNPNAKKECEVACYDCLLSYYNQRDHEIVDRKQAVEILKTLKGATIEVSPNCKPRSEHLADLMKLTGSSLEREWLQFFEENKLQLPTYAQKTFDFTTTRPDFYYAKHNLAVYIDGTPHDDQQQKEHDKELRDDLDEKGVIVVVFSKNDKDHWLEIVDQYRNIFYLDSERRPDGHKSESVNDSAWREILNEFDGFFGEDAKNFIKAAADAGIPAPSKDYVGYEVEGDDGEVVASLELAWPDKKIGFLTENQFEDKEKLEQKGWTIIDINRLSEAAEIFGGKEK